MSLSGRIRAIAAVALLGVCCFGGVGVAAAPVAPLAQPIAMDHTVSPGGVALAVSDELERRSGSPPKFKTFSEWSSSVNIGPPVNTVYEESAPAISADGRSLAPWGPAVNLGAPVNTEFNDRQAALSDDGAWLFFASNRVGFGSDDIWTSTREKTPTEGVTR